MTTPVAGLLLAAGSGTRFQALRPGEDKLLAPLPDGTPVAVAAARALRAALPRCWAVVRPGSAELAQALSACGLQVIEAPEAALGMGHSLAALVAATADANGWVVTLADMPAVQPDTIAQVAAALREPHDLAAPVHAGERGHPVGFGRAYRDELQALQGDRGARAILQRHAARLKLIETEDAGVLRDVDRPEDLIAR